MVEAVSTDWLRWIVALPLLSAVGQGFALGLLRIPPSRRVSAGISCASVGLAFAVGFASLLQLLRAALPDSKASPAWPGPALVDDVFTWVGAGRLQVEAGLLFDPLSAVLVLLITGVGLLVRSHAVTAMWGDEREDTGFQRFFCFLDLATASMLLLVLAENLALFFVGWQLVGMCLHLLVGFWYLDTSNSRNATRAIGVQLLGDGALLLAILLLFNVSPEPEHARLDFRSLAAALPALGEQTLETPIAWSAVPGMPALGAAWSAGGLVVLGFIISAACRAAQLPLHFWARDLHSTPLPALALLLTTTGLVSGVVLLLRVPLLLEAVPDGSLALAWIGVLTALLAAGAAAVQRDLRQALVFISLVQLGLCFLAVGLGAHAAALFHLVTHAVFLTTLLVACANIGLEVGIPPGQPIFVDRLGGLWRRLPRTHLAFLFAGAAAVGVPFTAGFFSRDQILLAAGLGEVHGRLGLQVTALLATGISAFVVARRYVDVFHGETKLPDERFAAIHERGGLRSVPLVVLALLSVLMGWMGPSAALNPFPVPSAESNSLANFVAPLVPGIHFEVSHGTERRLALVATGIALAFAWLGWRSARAAARSTPPPAAVAFIRSGFERVGPALERGLFDADHLMDAVVRPALRLADRLLMGGVEGRLAAGQALNTPARHLRRSIDRIRQPLQPGSPQGYVFFMLIGALAMLLWLLP